MEIKFINAVDLETCIGIIDDEPQMKMEHFVPGDIVEIDICDELAIPFAREIQFPKGDVAFVNYDFWKNVEVLM